MGCVEIRRSQMRVGISFRCACVVTALIVLTACGSDGDPVGPDVPDVATLTVDASEGWAYVRLGEEAQRVTVGDPSQSADWDLAFHSTSVMLNGGNAGPGGVVGHCLCQNAEASDAEVVAMTAASELDAFLDVGAADVPTSEDAWMSDALVPVIDGWYAYDFATHTVSAAPEAVWVVRTAEGDTYAKFHVIGIDGATQANAGRITIEYALQPEAAASMGEPDTAVVDVSGGPVHFDLVMGEESDGTDWDLRFEGYTIRVNGGVSGGGEAGAVAAGDSFEAFEDASEIPSTLYRGDTYGGVFDAHRWYRYDLEGNHQIWPTYDVYLIRRGAAVYKLQLVGYYGETGDSRQITFRYARLEE